MNVCIISGLEDLLVNNTGRAIRILNIANNLNEMGHHVIIVIPSREDGFESFNGIKTYKLKGLFPVFFLNFLSMIFGSTNITQFYFYDPFFIIKLCKTIKNFKIIQIESTWIGGLLIPFLKYLYKKVIIVDSHDVFQTIRLNHTSRFRKLIETYLEILSYLLADVVFVVSELERKILLNNKIDKDKIFHIPNGVDTSFFIDSNYHPKDYEKYFLNDSIYIIFVGNLNYYPNEQAIKIIVSKIMPELSNYRKNIKFIMVGPYSKDVYYKSKDIIYTGMIQHIYMPFFLKKSNIAIVPLLKGSGTRLKILEYLASGLPVIATTIAVEGLKFKNGEHLIIEDDINKFSHHCITLLNNKLLVEKITNSGRNFVIDNYDWNNIVGKMCDVYKKL